MNMKKSIDYRRLFSFAVIFMFVFALSATFVMAADTPAETDSGSGDSNIDQKLGDVFSGAGDSLGGMFKNWELGEVNSGFVKYLLWALVSMMVYSVGSKIPGLSSMFGKKEGGGTRFLGVAFSVLVGFLSMALIKPEELYAIMVSYSSLGFALGGFLPLVILATFTMSLATDKTANKDALSKITNKGVAMVMWAGYSLFAWIKAFTAPSGSKALSFIIAGLSLIAVLSISSIFKRLQNDLRKEQVDTLKTKLKLQKAKRDLEAADVASE